MRLVVHLRHDDDDDILSGRLWAVGAIGIEQRDDALIATFDDDVALTAARAAFADHRTEKLDEPAADLNRWRTFATPTRVAPDTLVVPAWDPVEPAFDEVGDAALVIPLDPGAAFGWGNHPTTSALAARLRRTTVTGRNLLDFGCGSGLLSIIAALSGAGAVTAVDLAPEARDATAANAERNDVSDVVDVAREGLDEAAYHGPFDLIMANVPIGVHEHEAADFGRRLAEDGEIWATGVTMSQVDRVIRSHRNAGHGVVALERIDLDDDWSLVILGGQGARPAAPSIP